MVFTRFFRRYELGNTNTGVGSLLENETFPMEDEFFCFFPLPFLTIMLAITFESSFGDKFMYQHAVKAPDEMRELHKQFYDYVKRRKTCGCKAKTEQ